MAVIVLLIIILLPLGLAVARRHPRTAPVMAAVDQGAEEARLKAVAQLRSIKEVTLDPAFRVFGAMLVGLVCLAGYHTYKLVPGGWYVALHLVVLFLSLAGYLFLTFFQKKVPVWMVYIQADNAEYTFPTQQEAQRFAPAGAPIRQDMSTQPMAVVYWLAWFVYVPMLTFVVNFGIGVDIESRYLILMGIGWGALAIISVFTLMATVAVLLEKVVGSSEAIVQLVTSTFGSLLPEGVDPKKIEAFFKRPNIGNEQSYLPTSMRYFWYVLGLYMLITVPCLIVVKNFYFLWAEMPPFVVTLIFTALLLLIKTQLKSVDTELLGEAAKLNWRDRFRQAGMKAVIWILSIAVTLLIIYACLSAAGWWDPMAQAVTGSNAGASTQGFWERLWAFFSVGFWATIGYYFVIPFLVIAGLLSFSDELEDGWGKKAAKGAMLLPLLVMLLGAANLVVNKPGFGGSSSTPAAPTASQPKRPVTPSPSSTDDDDRNEVANKGRNKALDEHCRKFGCPSSKK